MWQDGLCVTVGTYQNAEAAALSYARYVGRERILKAQAAYESARSSPTIEASEALAIAKREGLCLPRHPTSMSGFRGVSLDLRAKAGKAFEVNYSVPGSGGKQLYLGRYASAEEAALVLARYVAARQSEGDARE